MSAPGHRRGGIRADWRTPPEIVARLSKFIPLVVDLSARDPDECALPGMEPIGDIFNPDPDEVHEHGQLAQWGWCNPPYGRGIERWLEQLHELSSRGLPSVAILPNATDTDWFHRLVLGLCPVVGLLRGRVSFLDPESLEPVRGNPMGSVLAVFCRPIGRRRTDVVQLWGASDPSTAYWLAYYIMRHCHPTYTVRIAELLDEYMADQSESRREMVGAYVEQIMEGDT